MAVDSLEAPVADSWVTIAELGRLHGISRQAASKRVKSLADDGKLEVRADGQSRLVNAAMFAHLISKTTDPAQALRNIRSGPPAAARKAKPTAIAEVPVGSDDLDPEEGTSGSHLSYNDAKARRAAIDAEMADLALKERQGLLVSLQEAEDRNFEIFRRIRDRILSLPVTCADRLAAAPDARSIRMLLDDEMRQVLESLADEIEHEFEADGDRTE